MGSLFAQLNITISWLWTGRLHAQSKQSVMFLHKLKALLDVLKESRFIVYSLVGRGYQ